MASERVYGFAFALVCSCTPTPTATPVATPAATTAAAPTKPEPEVEEPESVSPDPDPEREPEPESPCQGLGPEECRAHDGCGLGVRGTRTTFHADGAELQGALSADDKTGYPKSRHDSIQRQIGGCLDRRIERAEIGARRGQKWQAQVKFQLRVAQGIGKILQSEVTKTDFPSAELIEPCIDGISINFVGGGVAGDHVFPKPKTSKHRGRLEIQLGEPRCRPRASG